MMSLKEGVSPSLATNLKPVDAQFKFFESSPKIFAKFNEANKGDI